MENIDKLIEQISLVHPFHLVKGEVTLTEDETKKVLAETILGLEKRFPTELPIQIHLKRDRKFVLSFSTQLKNERNYLTPVFNYMALTCCSISLTSQLEKEYKIVFDPPEEVDILEVEEEVEEYND